MNSALMMMDFALKQMLNFVLKTMNFAGEAPKESSGVEQSRQKGRGKLGPEGSDQCSEEGVPAPGNMYT